MLLAFVARRGSLLQGDGRGGYQQGQVVNVTMTTATATTVTTVMDQVGSDEGLNALTSREVVAQKSRPSLSGMFRLAMVFQSPETEWC